MRTIVVALFLAAAAALKADDFAARFAIVMIDDKTEAALGPFPYDRTVIAKAVEACAKAKAKAVVLKFFFDRPRSPAGDAALAESMTKIRVALQARLEASEGTTRPIPEKFRFAERRVPSAVGGDRGWIPLAKLMDSAAAVGFVDFVEPLSIPLIEEYRGVPYRSLILCCLELALDSPARCQADRIYVGERFLRVSARNRFSADLHRLEPLQIISFARLLAGQVEQAELAGRVVIIGLDSAHGPTLPTEHGEMGLHRFFVQCLAATYRAVADPSPEPSPGAGD